jgi:hypothetical protein
VTSLLQPDVLWRPESRVNAEQHEITDKLLGQAIQGWAGEAHATGVDIYVQGPLAAPGMDPTWIVRITAPWREAELFLFRGPHAEVTWLDPREPEPTLTC